MAVYNEGTEIFVMGPGDTGEVFFYPTEDELAWADTFIFGVKKRGKETKRAYVFKREIAVDAQTEMVTVPIFTEDTLDQAPGKYSWGVRLRRTNEDGKVEYRDTNYGVEPFTIQKATVHD